MISFFFFLYFLDYIIIGVDSEGNSEKNIAWTEVFYHVKQRVHLFFILCYMIGVLLFFFFCYCCRICLFVVV